jgi:hypothetical protein
VKEEKTFFAPERKSAIKDIQAPRLQSFNLFSRLKDHYNQEVPPIKKVFFATYKNFFFPPELIRRTGNWPKKDKWNFEEK